MSELILFLKNPWRWYKNRKNLAKRLKELENQDPFIYR